MNFNTLFSAVQLDTLEVLKILWITFPVIPLTALMTALAVKYLFKQDWAAGITRASHILQLLWALLITLAASSLEREYVFRLMDHEISIAFLFSREKLFFLWALMIPLFLSLFRLKTLKTFSMHMVFLFYLGGCSGLVTTGDVFNFFVFYELMIMGAYVLISIKDEYSASVKYLIFGAASSAIFLAGIAVLYTSGAYFDFTYVENIQQLPQYTLTVALILFTAAFLIKGGFFPVSGWVAPCHSAANALVASFHASYTIFTGSLGLYYLVLLPADAMGAEQFFSLLRIISVLTLCASSVILFWEHSFIRSIAASTVFTMGMIGLLMSCRLYTEAGFYILLHAAYKSLLFYIYDEIEERGEEISLSIPHMVFLAVSILFAAGLFPSVTGALKEAVHAFAPLRYKLLLLITGMLVIGGFAKFRYRPAGFRGVSLSTLLSLGILTACSLLTLSQLNLQIPVAFDALTDLAAAVFVIAVSRKVFTRFKALHGIDRLTIYRNINQELLLAFSILMFSLLFILS